MSEIALVCFTRIHKFLRASILREKEEYYEKAQPNEESARGFVTIHE
jgi:hypothetical protein